MQTSKQEVVRMLRKAGFRAAADEAMRDLPDPVDLDYVQHWGYSAASPETFSSARWAAAPDAVRLARPIKLPLPARLRRRPQPGYHSN